MPRITFLSDFGTRDGYVGAVKGVIAAAEPSAIVDDIAHDLPRGDVSKASRVLARYWRRYPPGTVHLVVVDPGVGTERRAVAAEVEGRFFVAPDNGVLSGVLETGGEWRCVALAPTDPEGAFLSSTFHGRDLFAPAAARLSRGEPLRALGEPFAHPVLLSVRPVREADGWILGEVVEVDHFGNLATNLPPEHVRSEGEVDLDGARIPLRRTYGDARRGELLALVDSEGRIEVAVRDGSAARETGARVGSRVRVRKE